LTREQRALWALDPQLVDHPADRAFEIAGDVLVEERQGPLADAEEEPAPSVLVATELRGTVA
jgi:hypothetical protein